MRKISVLLLLFSIGACAGAPPSPSELALAKSALAPSSQAAAERAAQSYIESKLLDPESARYKFLPFTRGYVRIGSIRQFGIFLCGTVNAKNRMGGYTGSKIFMVYFDPHMKDDVSSSSIEEEYEPTSKWCNGLYGIS